MMRSDASSLTSQTGRGRGIIIGDRITVPATRPDDRADNRAVSRSARCPPIECPRTATLPNPGPAAFISASAASRC